MALFIIFPSSPNERWSTTLNREHTTHSHYLLDKIYSLICYLLLLLLVPKRTARYVQNVQEVNSVLWIEYLLCSSVCSLYTFLIAYLYIKPSNVYIFHYKKHTKIYKAHNDLYIHFKVSFIAYVLAFVFALLVLGCVFLIFVITFSFF